MRQRQRDKGTNGEQVFRIDPTSCVVKIFYYYIGAS